MFQFIHYLKFLFSATNQYGIHSPFVYQYLIKCLYKKSGGSPSKSLGVLLKSIDYFKATSVWLPSDQLQFKSTLKKRFPQLTFTKTPYDILYIPGNELSVLQDPDLLSKNSHRTSLLLIAGIHKNREVNAVWNELILQEDFHVSIDFFYCGALFYRNEQRKQHFKIRI